MDRVVDIKYVINWKVSEETILKGLKEGTHFNLGNDEGIKILIKNIELDKVTLEIQDACMLSFPNGKKEIDVKDGEEIEPFLSLNPSPNYTIKVFNIREEKRQFYM